LQTLKNYPDYKFVCVGHSLGAGTAALMTIILHDEYNIPIHCYAYATPCVLSLPLAKKCKDFITSFGVNDDLVLRLSYGSLEDLKHMIKHLLSQNEGKLARLFQLFAIGNNLGESLTNKIAKYLEVPQQPDLGINTLILSHRLYPPGTIYHIHPSIPGGKYDIMEESDPSLFHTIVISSTMFSDHMPNLYEMALEDTWKKILKDKDNIQENNSNISKEFENGIRKSDGDDSPRRSLRYSSDGNEFVNSERHSFGRLENLLTISEREKEFMMSNEHLEEFENDTSQREVPKRGSKLILENLFH